MLIRRAERFAGGAYQLVTRPYYHWRYRDEHQKRVQFEFESNHEAVYQALCSIPQIRVECLRIAPEKYRAWLQQAHYTRNVYRGNFTEKTLEHYLTVELLDFKPDNIVIDVASDNSPFVDVIERTTGCQIYEQDIIYTSGIHGRKIGGNAAHIPLPDHSVNKMTLHCSFEHFEGTVDSEFIHECGRLLAIGGQCAIVPLYITERRFHLSNPICRDRDELIFDADTPIVRDPFWAVARFSRFYDVESFKERIARHLDDSLGATVYFVENEKDVDQSCYVKFMLLLTKH
ncbi:hypothetical protein ES707_22912 [subsurface metagenome]